MRAAAAAKVASAEVAAGWCAHALELSGSGAHRLRALPWLGASLDSGVRHYLPAGALAPAAITCMPISQEEERQAQRVGF